MSNAEAWGCLYCEENSEGEEVQVDEVGVGSEREEKGGFGHADEAERGAQCREEAGGAHYRRYEEKSGAEKEWIPRVAECQ